MRSSIPWWGGRSRSAALRTTRSTRTVGLVEEMQLSAIEGDALAPVRAPAALAGRCRPWTRRRENGPDALSLKYFSLIETGFRTGAA